MSDCKHEWTENYYGHKCAKCELFFAFGCGPWDEPDDDEYECTHEDYQIDWEGMARCECCNVSWPASTAEIEHQEKMEREYAKWEERERRWGPYLAFWRRMKQLFRFPSSRVKSAAFDPNDEIPF